VSAAEIFSEDKGRPRAAFFFGYSASAFLASPVAALQFALTAWGIAPLAKFGFVVIIAVPFGSSNALMFRTPPR